MEIDLVSSLTHADERQLAPSVLEAIGAVLDRLSIAYAVRIKTNMGGPISRTRQASHGDDASDQAAASNKVESPVN